MVRNSELNAARRGAADKARARQQVRSQMTGTLVGIDPEDSRRVIVSFDGSEVSVLAGPDKLVPGSLVAVEVDALGAPVRVLGAVTVRPAGLDDDAPAPLPVVAMPELAARELTEAERLAILETEQGLADARADLDAAKVEAEANFGTLNEKLGQAFPTDIFDVGAALGAVEVDVLAQAALDAQGKATAAQEAAITAAQDFAAGKISEAELRAANDAQARANAARDAAIDAAALDATSKAGQALTGAKTYAEQQAQAAQAQAALDAQAVAQVAQEAAITAAAEHADLVAAGASQTAIDAAAADAQAKADAAEAAAKAHSEAQATAAETAAKTHATLEAARVKQEALAEAATDALSKANAAASAAQQAAEQYALAQAEGKAGAALAAAKAHAEAQAQAAQEAAETAAEAYADARKNEAIDAAALTAQTKADVAKQGAIEAAALDAQARADAAAQAAQQAAEEHADLVAQGASQAAIDAAALDAQAKADAARQSAIDAAALDAQAKADGARQSAISAAATDAQSKADAAASAAQSAAEAYALAQAQGLSGQALADAKADATAKANAAEQAAKDAAAADALAKANAARDAAIDVAKADLDALEVGGRNYMLNSAQAVWPFRISTNNSATSPMEQGTDEIGHWVTGTSASSGLFYLSTYANPSFESVQVGDVFSDDFFPVPDVYTQSVEVMSEVGMSVRLGSTGDLTPFQPGKWTQIHRTFTPSDTNASRLRLWGPTVFADPDIPVGTKLYLRNWKLERGSKATDWTPAPEDVDAGIAGAIGEAAITAQSKADAAQQAAIQAAAEHADLVAAGASQSAIDAAAQDAQAKADAAELAAVAAAKADLDALEVGGRNLIIRSTETENTWIDVTGSVVNNNNNSTSDYIRVPDSGVLTLTRTHTPGAVYFRIAWYDENMEFISREARGDTPTTRHAPDGAVYMRVSYPKDAQVKAERGTKATDWSPAPEDVDAGIADAHATASAAATAASLAQARADSAHSQATTAGNAATVAMNTADGKNTTSYKNVTTTPGPAPTNEVEGKNRRQFDMHRNRLSNGTIVGEWMWSGTSWVQVHMGDGVLRSLDVGKLTAGTANLETAVIQKLWANLAVVQRLQVEQSAYIDGVHLKDGAVTARTLNVVPESDTVGGMELKWQGLRIIPGTDSAGSAGSSISMRSDEATWINFVKSGVSTFSVGPEGNLIAQKVSAREIELDSDDLRGILDSYPRGNLGRSTMTGNAPSAGYGEANAVRVLMCTFRTPPDDRLVSINVTLSSNAGNPRRGTVHLRQSTGENVKATNSSKQSWQFQTDFAESLHYSKLTSVSELGWPYDATITMGVFVHSEVSGETIPFMASRDQSLFINDEGPVTELQSFAALGGGGSGTDDDAGTRSYTLKRTASWSRSFMDNGANVYPYGTGRAYQGYYLSANGTLASMIGFPSITADLNKATVKSVRVKLTNQHAYSSAGVTAYIGLHAHATAPSSFAHSVSSAVSKHFDRGQTQTITLPSTYYDKIKSGDYKGITLYINSTSKNNYGYWDGTTAELIVDYEK